MTLVQHKQRDYSLDLLRIIACLMVIIIHVRGNYTYNTEGFLYTASGFYLTAVRPCVPLFMMLSGLLLLPLRDSTDQFLKKRFSRVLIPFLVWSILYAFFPMPHSMLDYAPQYAFTPAADASVLQQAFYNMLMIPVTFTGHTCHFWFLFALMGLYLFMPILSPWVKQSNGYGVLYFLIPWTFTLFIPYLKYIGIAQFQGLCAWNDFGMTYYFAGYMGYLLLGYFLYHYNTLSFKKSFSIGFILFLIGYAITYWGFVKTGYERANSQDFELFINNLTPNVAMMTAGFFMMFQKIKIKTIFHAIIERLSRLSFGIFLVHWVVAMWIPYYFFKLLTANHVWIDPAPGMPLLTLIVFLVSWGIIELVAKLPKSKWLIG